MNSYNVIVRQYEELLREMQNKLAELRRRDAIIAELTKDVKDRDAIFDDLDYVYKLLHSDHMNAQAIIAEMVRVCRAVRYVSRDAVVIGSLDRIIGLATAKPEETSDAAATEANL